MKVLLAATPVLGHLNPLLAIARMAASRGDDVVFTTGTALRSRVEDTGLRFVALDPDADIDLGRIEAAFPERSSLPPGPIQFRFDQQRIFLDPMRAQAESLRRIIDDLAIDIVVADSWFWGAKALFLDRSRPRPPIVACGITFLSLDRPDGAPAGPGLPPARSEAEGARYREIAATVDEVVTKPVRGYANAKLADMGLPPLRHPFLPSCVLLSDGYLQPTVKAFEYDFAPMPPHLTFVGPLPSPDVVLLQPPWWPELDEPRRVVLVTQGTVANHDFRQLVLPTLHALADRDDLLVLVTTGGRPVESVEGPWPTNARVERFLDYGALLPKVDVVVTNGGYNTVSLALKAGVPIVAAGRTEDKAEIGARVAWSGVGIEIPSQKPSPDEIGAAVESALSTPSYRAKAREVAADMAAVDTRGGILRVLDALVAARGDLSMRR